MGTKRTAKPADDQQPILAVVRPVPEPDFDAEFAAAMLAVAKAYERAITMVSPGHPDLDWLQASCRDARVCAQLAPVAAAQDAPERLSGTA